MINFIESRLQNVFYLCVYMLVASVAQAQAAETFKILFGSCLNQNKPVTVMDTIYAQNPDMFIFLGDNVYGDSEDADLSALKKAYSKAGDLLQRGRLGEVTAIWDDHDYGRNDGGGDYPHKAAAEDLFLDFWQVSADDDRRQRPGIYFAQEKQLGDTRLQIIYLDTRYFRSPLAVSSQKFKNIYTQYVANTDAAATLLGADQWAWLERELAKSADIRIIASSIQILATAHKWEKWANFPSEREKLLSMIEARNGGKMILLSGDRHFSAFYELDGVLELTSSSLNNSWKGANEADPLLSSANFGGVGTFGEMLIDRKTGRVTLFIKDEQGDILSSELLK